MRELVSYWVNIINNDLKTFRDVEYTISYICDFKDQLKIFEFENKKGVAACVIYPDWQGYKVCAEMVLYIKPQYRGNVLLFKRLIKSLENAAKVYGCDYITIGADIGYRDEKVLNLLSKLGYRKDTLRKDFNHG